MAEVRTARVRGKVKRMGRFVGKRPDWKKAWVRLAPDSGEIEFFEATLSGTSEDDHGDQEVQTDQPGPALHDDRAIASRRHDERAAQAAGAQAAQEPAAGTTAGRSRCATAAAATSAATA